MDTSTMTPLVFKSKPDLNDWTPLPRDIFYAFDGENIIADYNGRVGKLEDISTFPIFYIRKLHYKRRMDEIAHYLNYFTHFYDLDRDFFFSVMAVKFQLDTHPDIPQQDFLDLVMDRIVTPRFISKCKLMACDLYHLNINQDTTGKFNNTPKITNQQAYQIVAVSFCLKLLTPIMVHFSNVDTNFNPAVKTEYIKWFDKLFNRVIKAFENGDVRFYIALCKFIVFRGEKMFRNNSPATYQKKMLHGDTIELHNEYLIHHVVCVKTLYKLDYHKSCVAYIDGVIHKYHVNYLKEKFPSKPYEIDSDDRSKDSDESLSHAEAIEMTTYKRDESAAIVADVNTQFVMAQLREWYRAFNISRAEMEFYYANFCATEVSEFLFVNFFTPRFKDSFACINLSKADKVYLMICLKRIFEYHHMPWLATLCTARMYGRYKENLMKNQGYIDEVTSSPTWSQIIVPKFRNIDELNLKEDPRIKMLCTMINGSYKTVDFDEEMNDFLIEHVDKAAISHEFLRFLSII